MNSPQVSPRIAVITANTLTGLGLRGIVEKIIPVAEVCVFQSFAVFAGEEPDTFFHYFIDSQTYIEQSAFFAQRRHKTILLTAAVRPPQSDGMHCINICAPEESIVREILRLHQNAHAHGVHGPIRMSAQPAAQELTPREREVLVLVAKGLMNKEIADRLNISLTTVISHRRNISDKLGVKSVSGLTIYAVMRGYVDADSI